MSDVPRKRDGSVASVSDVVEKKMRKSQSRGMSASTEKVFVCFFSCIIKSYNNSIFLLPASTLAFTEACARFYFKTSF